MKHNLEMLKDGLLEFENDAEKSLFFYNNPRARAKLIQDMLAFICARIDNKNDPLENKKRVHEIVSWLDNNYHGFEWPAHEVHFHTNFFLFVTCTFTCIPEITDVLDKIINKRFAA